MPDRITKLQRWLDLIAYLASRRFPVPLDELWAGVPAYAPALEGSDKEHESVRRMFERDKKELRELGIPIETVTFHINYGVEESHGYRLAKKDFHLPYMRIIEEATGEGSSAPGRRAGDFAVNEAEMGAALDGLREVAALPAFALTREAQSAFRKLTFDLDPELLSETPVIYAEDAETRETAQSQRVLSEALRHRKTVRFRYRSMGRDAEGDRTVRPYGLLFQHGRWYLVGHTEDRGDVRMFRIGRMTGLEANTRAPGTPDFEVPADFRLDDYSGRRAWELGEDPEGPLEATVSFRFPRSLWAERNGHGRLLTEDADGTHLRSFDVHRRDPFMRWVLSMAGDARIEHPPELREAFQQMVSAVAQKYDPGEGGRDA
jgi:proteasome accessory factor B